MTKEELKDAVADAEAELRWYRPRLAIPLKERTLRTLIEAAKALAARKEG